MSVPSHFRFTFRGDFNGTPEHWSFGCHFTRTISGGPDAHTGDINRGGVTAALQGLFQELSLSSITECTDWRAYEIATNGKVEPDSDILLEELAPNTCKGSTSPRYPLQVTAAATLVADNRGPAHLGRFFLPGITQAVQSDMRWTATEALAMAVGVRNFLKGISDSIDAPLSFASAQAVNVSPRGGPNGTIQNVDHVEFGRRPDILRSRAASLLEERAVGAQIDW